MLKMILNIMKNMKIKNLKFKQNNKFDINLFNKIIIGGDGNCLYRSISYYLSNKENINDTIRSLVYNYIKNNRDNCLQFCYNENDIYFLKVEYKYNT